MCRARRRRRDTRGGSRCAEGARRGRRRQGDRDAYCERRATRGRVFPDAGAGAGGIDTNVIANAEKGIKKSRSEERPFHSVHLLYFALANATAVSSMRFEEP